MTDAEVRAVDTVAVRVWYDGDPGWLDVEPVENDVTGRADERFIDALARTFGPRPETNSYCLVMRDGKNTVWWLGEITEHVTLGDMVRVADGQVLQVDVAGRGGGPIPLVWDMVNAGLTVAGLVGGGKKAQRAWEAGRLRSQRQAARDWVDEGTDTDPPMVLRRFVFERDKWDRRDFDRTFALDRDPGSTLLRRLRYRKITKKPEVWQEPDPDAS